MITTATRFTRSTPTAISIIRSLANVPRPERSKGYVNGSESRAASLAGIESERFVRRVESGSVKLASVDVHTKAPDREQIFSVRLRRRVPDVIGRDPQQQDRP